MKSKSSLRGILPAISKDLRSIQENREFLLKKNRDVIRKCSESIISVHRNDLASAEKKCNSAKLLLDSLRKKTLADNYRYISAAEQELVEAYSLFKIVKNLEIPSVVKLGVRNDSYILGLLDLIGELRRLVYDQIREKNFDDASHYFEMMENLYLELYPFAVYDKVVGEVRKKLDVNKKIIDDARAVVTEEKRRIDLISRLEEFKKGEE